MKSVDAFPRTSDGALPVMGVERGLEEEQGPGFVHRRAFSEEGLGEGWLRSLYFVNKGLSSQGYGFFSGHVWM